MNSRNSQFCRGISNSTGNPCRNYVLSGDFCRHHKEQICGKNKYGVLITQASENNSKIKQSQSYYCNWTTAAGQPCKMRVKSNDLCCHHKNQNIDDKFDNNQNVTVTPSRKCNAITKNGKRCRNSKNHGKFCHKHNDNAELSNTLFVPGRAKPKYYSIDGMY